MATETMSGQEFGQSAEYSLPTVVKDILGSPTNTGKWDAQFNIHLRVAHTLMNQPIGATPG